MNNLTMTREQAISLLTELFTRLGSPPTQEHIDFWNKIYSKEFEGFENKS